MRIAEALACRQNYVADHLIPSENSYPRGLRRRLARVLRAVRPAFPGHSGRQRGRSVRVNPASSVALRSSHFPLRSAHGSHKVCYKFRVFPARFCFHSTANIHCVWFGRANRFCDVLRRQTSGQKNVARAFRPKRDVPAKGLSASAVAATVEAVEQKCRGTLKPGEIGRAERASHPDCFDYGKTSRKTRDIPRRFFAVKLEIVEADLARDR